MSNPQAILSEPTWPLLPLHVWRRARMLKRLNRNSRKPLTYWLADAWAEVQRGETEHWDFLSRAHKITDLKRQLRLAEMNYGSDRYSPYPFETIRKLRAEIAALERK